MDILRAEFCTAVYGYMFPHLIQFTHLDSWAPVFPVFFMVVWLDDSALNFSSISSWYSSETTACSSVISTGDWFFAAHSGYEAAQPLGPWLPAGMKTAKKTLMKNLDLSPPASAFVQEMWPQYTVDNIINTATAALLQQQRQLGFNMPLMVI